MLNHLEREQAIRKAGEQITVRMDASPPAGIVVEPDTEIIAEILLRAARDSLEWQPEAADATGTQPANKRA